MRVICSPCGIVYAERPGQGIHDIAESGFQEIVLDLSMYCNQFVLEGYGKKIIKNHQSVQIIEKPETMYDCVKAMLDKCAKEKLHLRLAVAPYLCRDTTHKDLNNVIHKLSEESIKICAEVGCQYLVVRPLFAGIAAEDIWKVNREYYLSLADLAKKNNVMLLLENQCRDISGHLIRGICADGVQAVEWIDRLNAEVSEERFGFCMDVGTCNLCGQNMYDFAVRLGDRLKTVILRDCNGNKESAMLPFTSVHGGQPQTDWLNLIRGLREIHFDGQLVLNMSDTATAFSPILRPQLMQLAKSVADYFKWQIEIESLLKKYPSRVLFGAGNMCRNYMKCYGEKYPPLYTCDNNKSIWGTKFCGLEVKSPESLKTLPDTTAIFICNIYYREIEQQLREMGLQNPIEFFNDEYMPTFYFDRLEAR